MKVELDSGRGLSVREDGYCFACGLENPIGLKLGFQMVDGHAETTFVPRREHQGFVGIIHGGLIGLVWDEAMAKPLHLQGIEALTREITARLRRVGGIGEPLRIAACLVGERGRLLELEASASDRHGETVAVAHARFLRARFGET